MENKEIILYIFLYYFKLLNNSNSMISDYERELFVKTFSNYVLNGGDNNGKKKLD